MDPRRRLGLIAAACVVAATARAHAEPTDRDRALVATRIAVEGIGYLVAEFGLATELAPMHCRWCEPDAFDGAMADALAWRNTNLANAISDATGYAAAPIAASALLVAASWGHGGWRREFDDVSTIVEAAIVTSLVQHVATLAAARERPYVYHAIGALPPTADSNVSFWSGHTSLAFSLATAAGSVAELRGYALAPAIWATGLSLAADTGYLRIAADKHWTTDVLTGAAVGSILGYVWPRYVRRDIHRDLALVPTAGGLALAGTF